MSKEKQIDKKPKQRQDYLKFKPFADDLRKAESWCELDGVLNRYQTVKNLSKMGYRKQSEGEWITVGEELKNTTCSVCGHWVETPYGKTPFCPNCGAHMRKEDEGK